jgi:hypothetical protein
MRLSAAMVRASKLTGIATEELQSRIRAIRSSNARANGPKPQPARPIAMPRGNRPLSARERAERDLLGAILNEPNLWEAVQAKIGPADIASPDLRQLAETLWDAHRNEGTLPLSELLDVIDPETKSVALESAAAAQQRGDPKRLIEVSLADLQAEIRRAADAQRMKNPVAPQSEADELDMLRQAAERAKQADLKRH